MAEIKIKISTIKDFLIQNPKPIGFTFLIVMVFGMKTVSRNAVWKNNYSLFSNDAELSPNSARTHYYLGNYIKREEMLNGKTTGEKDRIMKKSISELKIAVTIAPDFTDAWNQLGVAYDRINKQDSALMSYQIALKQNPDDPIVLNNIGTLFFKSGNYKQAVNAFTKATLINPNYSDAFANLANCYGVMNDFNAAITNFKRTIEIDPNNQQAYYLIALAYQKLGDIDQAQFYTNKAKSLDSKHK